MPLVDCGVRTETVVHVVEPQALFVPELVEMFSEAGLAVTFVGDRLDPRKLLDDEPDLVFLDVDELESPEGGIRLARTLVPEADIFVYTPHDGGEHEIIGYLSAGATVVLERSVSRREFVQRLRESDRRRRISRGR